MDAETHLDIRGPIEALEAALAVDEDAVDHLDELLDVELAVSVGVVPLDQPAHPAVAGERLAERRVDDGDAPVEGSRAVRELRRVATNCAIIAGRTTRRS